MIHISRDISAHVQEFKPLDFLKAFLNIEVRIGIIIGILGFAIAWAINSSKGWGYLWSIESIIAWGIIVLSIIVSYAFSIGNSINKRIKLIQEDIKKIEQENTFNPEETDILHKFDGLIAITDAEPTEWFKPFYYFYLINNGLVTLKWRNEPICLGNGCIQKPKFSFLDKTVAPDDYQKERSQILTDLKNGMMNISNLNKTLRFMFISSEDFLSLQHNVACLYAIHDLFGAHLFVLNKSLLVDNMVAEKIKELRAHCRYDDYQSFDVAFGINRNPQNITALYVHKVSQNITEFPNVSERLLIELLKIIATKALDEVSELKPKPENKIKYHLAIK
jgi:hypothetical protein